MPGLEKIANLVLKRGKFESDVEFNTWFDEVSDERATKRRDVKVGHEDAQASIITEGVSAGDRVVIDGASRLNDNTKVTVVQPAAAGGSPAAEQPAAPGTRRRRAGGGAAN